MRGVRLGIILIVLLALLWAALLLPAVFRTKIESSPIDGVRSFERSMGILANTRNRKAGSPGRWIMVPRTAKEPGPAVPGRRSSRVIRRRRRNFERLLAACAATLFIGFIPGLHWIWFVHLAADGALGFYITRLLRYKHQRMERAEKVMTLPSGGSPSARASSG